MSLHNLAGYAVPWNVADGEQGMHLAPGAILPTSKQNVTLVFGSHAEEPIFAQTRDHTLTLFSDDFGLGFTARVDALAPFALPVLRAIASSDVCECSVMLHHFPPRADGRLVSATISHIAMLAGGKAVWGADTGVWLQDQPLAKGADADLRRLRAYHEQTVAGLGNARPLIQARAGSPPQRTGFAPPEALINRIDSLVAQGGRLSPKMWFGPASKMPFGPRL